MVFAPRIEKEKQMKIILQDLRFAVRMFFRQPKTSAVVVLTLALGIGSCTAVFTILNSVVLRPLAYNQPERLVRVYSSNPKEDAQYFSVSPADYYDWKKQSVTIEDLAALTRPQDFNLTILREPEHVSGTRVSPNIFSTLGVNLLLGRTFSEDENHEGGVVILSYDLWRTHFGQDQQIAGRTVSIDGKPVVVVGVTPSSFKLPYADAAMFLPPAFSPNELKRSNHFLRVLGRLKQGVTMPQAMVELKTVARRLENQYPAANAGWTIIIRNLNEVMVPETFRRGLWIFLGAVILVLMIACVNVTNLMVARTLSRQREIAVRVAMGGSRYRLLRQLITESILPAALGGALGVLLAVWGIDWIRAQHPANIPRLDEIRVNGVVLAFSFCISLLTALVYGGISALHSLPQNVQESLKEASNRGTQSGSRGRVQNLLVITEAALAVILLVGACLLIKSFLRLQFVDPGFHQKNLLTVAVALPENKYSELSAAQMISQLVDRAAATPGVKAVATASMIPLGPGNSMDTFTIQGRPPVRPGESQSAAFRIVSPNYFSVMNIPLLRGRYFQNSETADSPRAVVIDDLMQHRYWPNEDPLGKQIVMAGNTKPLLIVGIVRAVKSLSLDAEDPPMLYFSTLQTPARKLFLVVSTSGNPLDFAGEVRRRIRGTNPDIVIGNVTSMEQVMKDSLSQQHFQMAILTFFAGIALMLAAVGIYSVIAYRTALRTHEIGIRMAVGARQSDVVKMVVQQGILLAGAGIAIGLIGSYGATQLLSSLLFQVSPTDGFIFQISSVFFLLIAALASLIPAHKASKLDPLIALRHE